MSMVGIDARARALEALAGEIAACHGCELAATRTKTVPGTGTGSSGICVVGEAPGAREDQVGEPFVGRSGQLLDRLLDEELGLTRSEIAIVNVVKCRPPANRAPKPAEVSACGGFLERQLEVLSPGVIVTLGNVATRLLLRTTEGITTLRGKTFPYGSTVVVPTFHPAAALRGGADILASMRADLVRAKEVAQCS